jgi:hypothetical protein
MRRRGRMHYRAREDMAVARAKGQLRGKQPNELRRGYWRKSFRTRAQHLSHP